MGSRGRAQSLATCTGPTGMGLYALLRRKGGEGGEKVSAAGAEARPSWLELLGVLLLLAGVFSVRRYQSRVRVCVWEGEGL